MYALFEANINIQGKGGIVAAPDRSTPGGSYYYHWMRDAALTMRTYMELNDMNLGKVEEKMKAYVSWVNKVQKEVDPNGFDIRINPKFELPNGDVYVGGWCRPQTDGPGLRSASLIMFGNLLLDGGQQSYFNSDVWPAIKFDLAWVFDNWDSNGCDLWEEVRSNDFFWNRAGYVYTLDICNKLATKVGDSALASKCSAVKSAIQATLDGHWTGTFMKESANREQDSSVIHAFSSFETHSLTDEKVAKTISTYSMTFCGEYQINQQDNKAGIPGILLGRYPGDSYAGGNPWQLLTAVLGKTFYQGATALQKSNGFSKVEDKKAWSELLSIDSNSSTEEFIKAQVSAGDAVMYRLFQHVKSDGGHIAEQIGRNSGTQASANDLTWSYANLLSAYKARAKAVESLELVQDFELELE